VQAGASVVLAPGITATDITLARVPEVFDRIGDTVPLSRAATPPDTAEGALYLCSATGQFVTGTLLTADGGESLA
jgi:3-oxoacyl-[acyl-carrier protein] reductase